MVKNNKSHPVYTMDESEQVDLLAIALLREYMSKKKYKETLEVFEVECPRSELTITSRSVMNNLLNIPDDIGKACKENGLSTIIEMLCYQRVLKQTKEGEIEEMRKQFRAKYG